jgi:hypothetical protein
MTGTRRDEAAETPARADPTIMIFLALFTLLLAFMILFNGVATREAAKTEALIRSLNDAFGAPGGRPSGDPLDLARDAFRNELGSLLARTLPDAADRPDQRNGAIVAIVPTARLFREDVAELHSKSRPLLEGLAALLAASNPERRAELGALVRTGAALPAGDGLESRRAGALARELLRLGAPADAVSVGLSPGDAAAVEFAFRLLPRAASAR